MARVHRRKRAADDAVVASGASREVPRDRAGARRWARARDANSGSEVTLARARGLRCRRRLKRSRSSTNALGRDGASSSTTRRRCAHRHQDPRASARATRRSRKSSGSSRRDMIGDVDLTGEGRALRAPRRRERLTRGQPRRATEARHRGQTLRHGLARVSGIRCFGPSDVLIQVSSLFLRTSINEPASGHRSEC